jgi:glyoxylase-like metal-dependent hydrolase (beta-lactamase superfamily II)
MENVTMADVRTAIAPRDFAFTETPARTRPTFWSKLLAAMMASRQRQAEREIARYLRDHGGKFTDEAEREIERRFLSSPAEW